jgi:hypothetical protein
MRMGNEHKEGVLEQSGTGVEPERKMEYSEERRPKDLSASEIVQEERNTVVLANPLPRHPLDCSPLNRRRGLGPGGTPYRRGLLMSRAVP